MVRQTIAALLITTMINAQAAVGGYQNLPCNNKNMLGSPVIAFKTIDMLIGKVMNPEEKNNLTLLHFSNQIVAGTNYKIVFKTDYTYADNTTEKYFGYIIYVPLPYMNEKPDITKMLVSDTLDDVLGLLGLEKSQITEQTCANDLKQIYLDNNKDLLESSVDQEEEVQSSPENETTKKDDDFDKSVNKTKNKLSSMINRLDKLLERAFGENKKKDNVNKRRESPWPDDIKTKEREMSDEDSWGFFNSNDFLSDDSTTPDEFRYGFDDLFFDDEQKKNGANDSWDFDFKPTSQSFDDMTPQDYDMSDDLWDDDSFFGDDFSFKNAKEQEKEFKQRSSRFEDNFNNFNTSFPGFTFDNTNKDSDFFSSSTHSETSSSYDSEDPSKNKFKKRVVTKKRKSDKDDPNKINSINTVYENNNGEETFDSWGDSDEFGENE